MYLKNTLNWHWLPTLLIMCIAALVFFFASFNLFFLFQANVALIWEHGSMALLEGALRQFVELSGLVLLSACAYIAIKACEKVLVERLLR